LAAHCRTRARHSTSGQDFPDIVSVAWGALYVRPDEGIAVAVYRFYFLDAADRVAAAEVFHCANDVDAQARADKLLTGSIHPAIEVWDRIQVVYRARKPD
jgi:hypothetical protein